MESDLLHILKELFFILIGPIMGLFAWIGKRLHTRIDNMEKEIHILETDSAVQYSRLKDIKEDIQSLDKKQDKMDTKIDKILDKVRD
jgi:peptidoglycan hydrolase CwlO-like protein